MLKKTFLILTMAFLFSKSSLSREKEPFPAPEDKKSSSFIKKNKVMISLISIASLGLTSYALYKFNTETREKTEPNKNKNEISINPNEVLIENFDKLLGEMRSQGKEELLAYLAQEIQRLDEAGEKAKNLQEQFANIDQSNTSDQSLEKISELKKHYNKLIAKIESKKSCFENVCIILKSKNENAAFKNFMVNREKENSHLSDRDLLLEGINFLENIRQNAENS